MLSACGGGAEDAMISTHYDPPGKPGGRMCTVQCHNALDHCQDSCKLQQRACSNGMQAQAIHDYETYTVDQFKSKQPVELRPRDFERPEQCIPVKCNQHCKSSYNGCFEKCGGTVSTTSACKYFCF